MKPNNAIGLGAALVVIAVVVVMAFDIYEEIEWIDWDLYDITFYTFTTLGLVTMGVGAVGTMVQNKNRSIFVALLAFGLVTLLAVYFLLWW
jgi:hypothetical protein